MLKRLAVISAVLAALGGNAALPQAAAPVKCAFDVVSIKVQDPNEREIMAPGGTPEDFEARGVTAETLVAHAFDLQWTQGLSESRDPRYSYYAHSSHLIGDRGWADTEQFDLTAKADPAVLEAWKKLPSERQDACLREMVLAMLKDRFRLQVHTEKRGLPAYALVVAKGGPKMTPSQPDPPAAPDDPDHPKPYESPWRVDLGLIAGHGVTMDELAEMLWAKREIGGRDVIDRTGLPGKYDFKLKWTPEGDPDDAGGVSLFTAIQEQLGLKLEPVKAPTDVVVIDHIEKPTEN
ncbi:MAG TPA: TIGR03435 family protein [Acidobacteriaceae bacterium]|nr:TIGR03435 family protein [Acidobacteriaceae bacterium]